MSLQELLQEKRQEILDLADQHGAFNVRVFGSVVRGEDTPDSDIDFLIDYDVQRISSWFPVRLIRDLERLLNHPVDVVTEDSLKPRICEKILREAVKL
jgi:hypothetical protein